MYRGLACRFASCTHSHAAASHRTLTCSLALRTHVRQHHTALSGAPSPRACTHMLPRLAHAQLHPAASHRTLKFSTALRTRLHVAASHEEPSPPDGLAAALCAAARRAKPAADLFHDRRRDGWHAGPAGSTALPHAAGPSAAALLLADILIMQLRHRVVTARLHRASAAADMRVTRCCRCGAAAASTSGCGCSATTPSRAANRGGAAEACSCRCRRLTGWRANGGCGDRTLPDCGVLDTRRRRQQLC